MKESKQENIKPSKSKKSIAFAGSQLGMYLDKGNINNKSRRLIKNKLIGFVIILINLKKF